MRAPGLATLVLPDCRPLAIPPLLRGRGAREVFVICLGLLL